MLAMGVLGLVCGDFALVWQPVATWVPGRTALAYATAVLMLAIGAGLLFEPALKWAVRALFLYLIAWMLLKVPALFVAPQIEGVWLGFAELAALMAGGWVLFARLGEGGDSWIAGERGVRLARLWFGLWLIPIGLSHLMYVGETIKLIPHWIPYPVGWAYLTGVGQMACGLGILTGVARRVAAWCEAGMITIFALLVWAPAIAAAPKARLPWTAFWITWVIGAAAWTVAVDLSRPAESKETEPIEGGRAGKPELVM